MERMLVIGNPGNRRTASLQSARARLGLPPAEMLTYDELLRGGSLTEAVRARVWHTGRPPLLRLDAPGECFEVERGLIALGAPDRQGSEAEDRLLPFGHRGDPEPISSRAALLLQEQVGRLYHPSQWFRGYGRLLGRLEREADELWPGGPAGSARWMNAPGDVIAMFDKRHTSRLLSAAAVPVPPTPARPETLTGYEALREALDEARMYRVFVKLACGSGASGVIAYQVNPKTGAEIALTTLGVESFVTRPPVYYNASRVKRYTDRVTIRRLIDWLLRHGAQVERWIAKASRDGRSFDIRQLVVLGQACHRAARISSTPMTNLHLGSERMDPAELGLAAEALDAVRDCAERALAAFPRSGVAGIDVMLDAAALRPYVADVNPFGDLLYRVAYRGCDPYEWELRRYAAAEGEEGRLAPCRI